MLISLSSEIDPPGGLEWLSRFSQYSVGAANDPPHHHHNLYTSTRDNTTNMTPILDAITAIDAQEPGAHLSYRAAAKKFGVNKDTLRRKHKGLTHSHAGDARQRMLLDPQQEIQLVQYIEKLSSRSIPPTRSIIQNYASAVAKWEVSDSWVTRFLQRNRHNLTSQWCNNMDCNRHHADSAASYRDYFELLHSKLQEYDVDARNIYNMDEKGFAIGVTSKTKRVFSKTLFQEKKKTVGLQDGNREWITILACICADGSELDPAVIFAGKGDLYSGWVHNVEPGKHQTFLAHCQVGRLTMTSGWHGSNRSLIGSQKRKLD
jgi:hypothetical protein